MLIYGVILSSILIGTINALTSNNSNSRIRFFATSVNSALDSFVNEYRALLNDATYGNIFNQYWLVQGCSTSTASATCPKNTATGTPVPNAGIQNPSQSYWSNSDGFCSDYPRAGTQGCPGRQVSPYCSYSNPNSSNSGSYIDWNSANRMISTFYNSQKDISSGVNTSNTKKAFGVVSSYETIGQVEQGGRSHIDVSGLLKDGNNIDAERRARVSMEIERSTPYAGFAYISAGYQQSDRNSIHLSNLRLHEGNYLSGTVGRGTILLRRNSSPSSWNSYLLDPSGCGNSSRTFFYSSNGGYSYSLPAKDNGGLLLHSPYWPTSSNLSIAPTSAQSTIVRTTSTSSCLRANNQKERVYTYHNLFVLRGALFCIETSDSSKALIKVSDSIDVAPGSRFCHLEKGSSVCGSGKPENLTIVSTFKDFSTNKQPISDHSGCSNNRGGAGLGESYASRSENGSPGPSFTFRSTGKPGNQEKLSAFIYGKDLVFNSSGLHKGRRGTYLSDDLNSRYSLYSGSLVIHRSRIAATGLDGPTDTTVWRLLIPGKSDVVIQGDASRSSLNGMNDNETGYLARQSIVAIANRTNNYGRWYGVYPSIYITYDWSRGLFRINSFSKINSVSSGSTEGKIRLGTQLSRNYYTPWGTISSSFYPSQLSSMSTALKLMYGISITSPNANDVNPVRIYKGAVWARRVCFSRNWAYGDYLQSHHWITDPKFVDGLADRYGEEFRWGFSNYKSRFVKTWDILRDFYN